MISNIDWYFLKRTLIFLVIAVVLSSALIVLGLQFEDARYQEYKKGEASLKTVHSSYKKMVKDIDLMEQYTSKYSQHKASGLVGGERRLSWIESLISTNSVLKLPTLTYNLMSQEGFKRQGLKTGRGVAINSSPMELSMSLLHEEDLFALIEGLSLSISNLFTVDSCSILLSGKVGRSFDTQKSNMTSKCVIRWISIDVK